MINYTQMALKSMHEFPEYWDGRLGSKDSGGWKLDSPAVTKMVLEVILISAVTVIDER